MSASLRRVISVTAPSRPGMNGPATLYGAEGLLALCELSAWICGVSGDLGEQRVERDRVRVDLDGLQIPVIGRAALLDNKRAAGRKQDLADAEALEAVPDKPRS